MSSQIYHYTTGDRFLRIIASRAILPATAHVEPPEIPAVWLSSAPVWEPSATKGVIEDGVRRQASLAELIGLCGCLVRIEIDPSAVAWLGPSEFRNALRIPEDVHNRLIAAGLEMGANPADWSAVSGLSRSLPSAGSSSASKPTSTGSPGRASGRRFLEIISQPQPQPTTSPNQLPPWPSNLSQITRSASAFPATRPISSPSRSKPSW
jgi:hypothetical protein